VYTNNVVVIPFTVNEISGVPILDLCAYMDYDGAKRRERQDSCFYDGDGNGVIPLTNRCGVRAERCRVKNTGTAVSNPTVVAYELIHPTKGAVQIKQIPIPQLLPGAIYDSDTISLKHILNQCERYDSGFVQVRFLDGQPVVTKKVYIGTLPAQIELLHVPAKVTRGNSISVFSKSLSPSGMSFKWSAMNATIDGVDVECNGKVSFPNMGIAAITVHLNPSNTCILYRASATKTLLVEQSCTPSKPTVRVSYLNPNTVPCTGRVFLEKTGSDTARAALFTGRDTVFKNFPLVSNMQTSVPKGEYILQIKQCDSLYQYKVSIDCTRATSTRESEYTNWNLFPNPAESIITIESADNGILSVYDISGRKIIEKKKDNKQVTIDIQNFSAGVYILKFQNNEGRVGVKRVVKVK
jgi:hypothetical protein